MLIMNMLSSRLRMAWRFTVGMLLKGISDRRIAVGSDSKRLKTVFARW